MKKTVFLILFSCISFCISAQNDKLMKKWMKEHNIEYKIIDIQYLSSSNLKMDIMLYDSKKSDLTQNARYAALKTLLYDGVGKGVFSFPLLQDGEETSISKRPDYFYRLYAYRLNDFFGETSIISNYKKGDTNKGTLCEVIVKAILLRRDLENNNIKQKMGL